MARSVKYYLQRRVARYAALASCLGAWFLTACGPAKPSSTAAPAKAAAKPAGTATKAATNAAPAKAAVPKSVFVDDLKQGVDPFFPKSARRQPKITANSKPGVAAQPQDPFAEVILNGILGTRRRRIATINNRPFETGEMGEISTANGKRIQIKCLRIDETSVEIAIEGEPERKKILSLRKEL